jgi:tungstate transport system ATP-binding protein
VGPQSWTRYRIVNLQVDDVSRTFDGETVLRGVSLSVAPGEVVTVVGPSGAGKTTLLRLFGAFDPPDAGTIECNGRDLWAMTTDERLTARRQVATVFQEASLFNAPVRRNVEYGLRVRANWGERLQASLRGLLGRRSPPDRVEEALKTVGLAGKADRNALSLSGGEAQRVAFARALAVTPGVLLLDEPTSNLDPHNTALVEDAVTRARERGVGIVVATHDMHQARRLSDRVGFLFEGELVETGPPERLFEDPENPRTARFVRGELVYEADDHEGATPSLLGDD